jgi:hypothetical protein
MDTIDITFRNSANLGVVFDLALDEVEKAKENNIPVQVKQDREATATAIIVLIANAAAPFVKEFLKKFIGRIAENLADRLTKQKTIEPFTIEINGKAYNLPNDLDRLRSEKRVA